MSEPLKSPFPYFGGKSRCAAEVWRRFGRVGNYIEPFFGSGAVLLARPDFDDDDPPLEAANDLNAWIANFFRAAQIEPEAVAAYADWPVHELDLHARGDWLFYRKDVDREFVERLRSDPDWHDAKSAGWWVWGAGAWIGDNWGRISHNCRKDAEGQPCGVVHARPNLAGKKGLESGRVTRQMPSILPSGVHQRGIRRKRPRLNDSGKGVHRKSLASLEAYICSLRDRLRRVRFCCGDWSRVLGPSVLGAGSPCAVFLDPPYSVADRDAVYGEDESRDVAHDVREWCLARGDDRNLRLALCGYAGEHEALEARGWDVWEWKANGGYGSQAQARGRENAGRERIWFSSGCREPEARLFEEAQP